MKKILLKILLFVGILSTSVMSTMGREITLILPTPSGQSDLNIPSSQVNDDRTGFINLINTINKYLWFSLGLIGMIIFVYAGILLIAGGKKENFEKANNMLLGAGAAIVISMLSYTVVKLLINLF